MKKGIEHNDDHQDLEVLKAVAQAWHGRNSGGSASQDSGEFDARRHNFKTNPTRFRIEAINKEIRRRSTSSACWDFQQSLWDSYEIVSVSKKLEAGLLVDNPFPETKKKPKESKNSLRNLFNLMSSRRFDDSSIPREEDSEK